MKKNNREASRSAITTLPILPGTLVLCGCMCLLFITILIAVYASGMAELPGFLSAFLGDGDEVQADDGFPSDFLASLSGNAPVTDPLDEALLNLSPEALRDLLLRCTPEENYFQQMDVLRTDGSAFQTTRVTYIVSQGRVYVHSKASSGSAREILCVEDRCRITENGESRIFTMGEESSFTPEGEAGIPSFTRMQRMMAEAEEGKYILSTEITEGSPCIRVQFTDPVSGVREIFDVLPDVGVILSASSVLPDADVPYYQMTTVSVLTDLSEVPQSLFDIPTP